MLKFCLVLILHHRIKNYVYHEELLCSPSELPKKVLYLISTQSINVMHGVNRKVSFDHHLGENAEAMYSYINLYRTQIGISPRI